MSDSRRRYRAIRDALKRLYPCEPKGNLARHLNTLAALISGIVGSQRANLPAIAAKAPDRAKPESRIKRYARWIINEHRLFGISQGKATYSGTPIRRIGDSPQGRDKGVGTEL